MKKEINTSSAPQAIGPYSQAIQFHQLLFLSGQIPLDPQTGKIVGSTVKEQAIQILNNIKALLESQELTLSDVLKSTIFLTDLGSFNEFNEVYQSYFTPPYPARTTIEVSALPKDSLIEIEIIAGTR